MPTSKDALDMLYSSGAPSASFLKIGDSHSGRILSIEKMQQRDMATGAKLWWDDEMTEPKMQLVITIKTDERDPDIDGDDGTRRIFAKAQMLRTIRTAITDSGHTGDPERGFLTVTYTGDGKAKTKGFNPPKEYEAAFTPPTPFDDDGLDYEDDDPERPF